MGDWEGFWAWGSDLHWPARSLHRMPTGLSSLYMGPPRICPRDGQFRLSTWLDYSTQLSNQTSV